MRSLIHTAHLSVRFPEDIIKRLDAVSGPFGRTDFVRHALLEAIERAEAKLPKPQPEKSPSKPEKKPKTVVNGEPEDDFSEAAFWRVALDIDKEESYWREYIAREGGDEKGMRVLWGTTQFIMQKERPAV